MVVFTHAISNLAKKARPHPTRIEFIEAKLEALQHAKYATSRHDVNRQSAINEHFTTVFESSLV